MSIVCSTLALACLVLRCLAMHLGVPSRNGDDSNQDRISCEGAWRMLDLARTQRRAVAGRGSAPPSAPSAPAPPGSASAPAPAQIRAQRETITLLETNSSAEASQVKSSARVVSRARACLWVGLAVAEQQAPPHPAAHARAHLRRHTSTGNSDRSLERKPSAASASEPDATMAIIEDS